MPVLEPATGIEELLPALLTRLGITTWDVIIAGDGSGSGWQTPCGYGAVLIDRVYRGRRLFFGAANIGSVNLAESLPYLHAINWYDSLIGKALLRSRGVVRIDIITDSDTIARWGTVATQLTEPLPRKHIPIWCSIREYHRLGYRFRFHWAPRQTSGLNWAADLVAGLANRQFAATDPLMSPTARAMAALANIQLTTADGRHISVYDVNPSDDEEVPI